MSKHKNPKLMKKVEGFAMRTFKSGKETAKRHGTTSIIAIVMSSLIPMLEQWHADKQHSDEVGGITTRASNETKDAETRLNQLIHDLDDRSNKHIISVEDAENQKIKAIWDYISNQNKNGRK